MRESTKVTKNRNCRDYFTSGSKNKGKLM